MPKYNSIQNIPAEVYFKIKDTNDLQLLKPKPREKGLSEVFTSIDDEFFTQMDNPIAKRYLQVSMELNALEYKKYTIKTLLHSYYYNFSTKEMREELAETLQKSFQIDLDLNKDFPSEVLRILNTDVAFIDNDITFLKNEMKDLSGSEKQQRFNFVKSLAGMSTLLPNNSLLNQNITLAVYVELSKIAEKSIPKKK